MTDIDFDANTTTASTSLHPRILVLKAWTGGASPAAHFNIEFFFLDKKDSAFLTRVPVLNNEHNDVALKIWAPGNECPLETAALFETSTPPRTIFLASAARASSRFVMTVAAGQPVSQTIVFFRLDVNENEDTMTLEPALAFHEVGKIKTDPFLCSEAAIQRRLSEQFSANLPSLLQASIQ